VACISHPKDVINFSAFAFGRHGRPGPKKDTGQIGGSCLDEFAPRFEMPSGYFPLALPCLAGQISAENGKGHLEAQHETPDHRTTRILRPGLPR